MGAGKLVIVIVSSIVLGIALGKPLTDDICDGLPPNDVFPFPHEFNCSLFYECFNGTKTLNICPDGLWFNNKTESCDFPDQSGCSNGDPRCANIDIDYFPHLDNCEQYVECYHGSSYLMNCPDGYWFDSRQKMCVPPAQSDCGQATTHQPWTTPHEICWGVRPNKIVLKRNYDFDCNKYWVCHGANLLALESCGWLDFDEGRQMCNFHDIIECDATTAEPSPTSGTDSPTTATPNPTTEEELDPRCKVGDSYWFHPTDCTKYIQCWSGSSYEMTCPAGLFYTDLHKKCVNPDESECGKTEGPTPSTTQRSSDVTDDPDCPYPGSEGKLLPYPGDCTKYYECAQGKKVVMDCPTNLYFNPVELYCDYPYHAGCQWEVSSPFKEFMRMLYFIRF